MGGECSLEPKVVGGGDDAASEVVVPDAVDDDAGEEVTGAVVDIGHPVGKSGAAIAGAGPIFRRAFLPICGGLAVAHEDLEEARLGDAFLLVGITTTEEVGFRVEMGKAAAVRVVLGRGKAFAGDLDFGDVGFGFCGEGVFDGGVEFLPFCVALGEELEEGFAVFLSETIR